MKKRTFLISLIIVFVAEIIALILFATKDVENLQDAVAINEAVQFVQNNWDTMEEYKNQTNLNYAVVDVDGTVIFRTKKGLSESINAAVIHRDTILDVQVGGKTVGKMIIYNDNISMLQEQKQKIVLLLITAILIQGVICIVYSLYLNHVVIKPFYKLKGFAERIADGNLDIPLEMDRQNLFGAFTESFDIMRDELKAARIAEAKANASKKELVAKISHDIKTPVASIKAASEVGIALTDHAKPVALLPDSPLERIQDNYSQIIRKADQINTLITNLFTATMEELKQLSVMPAYMESAELKTLLENADYLHRAVIPAIPVCLIYADKLRLQQVFDNIFANSYKYANTKIDVAAAMKHHYLSVTFEDYGSGVSAEELPLLKKKFKRGVNADNIEGAGLGLHISDYFMKEMQGELDIQNGQNGLKVTVRISVK